MLIERISFYKFEYIVSNNTFACGSHPITMLNTVPNKVSLAGLHRYLPKDVRKLIYAKLDKYDIKLILSAHGSKEPILTVELSVHCAKNGHLELLKWARDNNCPWDAWSHMRAAMNGHLEILKYLHENGCPRDARSCISVAYNGHLEALIWLLANGYPRYAYTCVAAAVGGRLEVLKWLIDNGCPLDKSECTKYATDNKQQHIVDWLETV